MTNFVLVLNAQNKDSKNPGRCFLRKQERWKNGLYASHLRGMSWKVPSGRVLRMVMGRMFASNSHKAMSIGFVFSAASTKIGAPIEI